MAREAAEQLASPGRVGDWIEAVADDDRVVTHLFECLEPGYRGWRWASTVARASRARVVTLDEAVLLPGPGSLLAPEWLPWSERLRPGDLGPGDLLPTEGEDLRLEPGFTGEDSPPPNSAVAEDIDTWADAGRTEAGTGTSPLPPPPAPARGGLGAVAAELGMGRARVLSRYGLHTAADRWEDAHGPRSAMAQAAPASCVSCGFLVPLTGSLRQAFGVCANEYSPADGQVVSLSYGCGAHSEAAVMPKPPQPPPPVVDETRADTLPLHDEPGAPAEPSGSETRAGETGETEDNGATGEHGEAGRAGASGRSRSRKGGSRAKKKSG